MLGRWGVVEVEVDGRLVCHECGQAFEALGVHVGTRLACRRWRRRALRA